jgi:hypothetical protein
MGTYSETRVYDSGLYLLGLSNYFMTVNKKQQTLSFPSLKTFTSDFYTLSASIQVSYQFTFNTADSYTTISTFYESMGNNP